MSLYTVVVSVVVDTMVLVTVAASVTVEKNISWMRSVVVLPGDTI